MSRFRPTRLFVFVRSSVRHVFDPPAYVGLCTSAPHWVTQIAAGRLDEGNKEKDEVGKEEVGEMRMVAVGECSEAGRPGRPPLSFPSLAF